MYKTIVKVELFSEKPIQRTGIITIDEVKSCVLYVTEVIEPSKEQKVTNGIFVEAD